MCRETINIHMTLYPTVWPLPFGVTIPETHSPDHYYSIPKSQTQCWPVKLGEFKQVYIVGMHSGIEGNQYNTIIGWMSIDPNGTSIIPPLSVIPYTVHFGTIGNSWCFHVDGHTPVLEKPADITWLVDPDQIYYFNVKNLENKNNSYYLRFTYGQGDATVEL